MSDTLDGPASVSDGPDPTIPSSTGTQLLQLPTELLIDIIANVSAAYLEGPHHESDPLVALRL